MNKEYTDYIVSHCENVRKAYDWLVNHGIIHNNFSARISQHDLSKYSEQEYDAYADYFYGGKKTKEIKEAFDYAWLHHIHNNPHHWQYWVLINDDDGTEALEMTQEYIIEMFCDHWSFSHKTGKLNEIFKWYANHKDTMILHKNTRRRYEELLAAVKKILEDENGKTR